MKELAAIGASSRITMRDQRGQEAGTIELDDGMFAVPPNIPVMHQVVTAQLASRRRGTQSTKTRAEVRGGGAKPWKQKGTGRARAGSSRSPIWSGGGVSHGPKPRSYGQRTPKKMIRLALASALSDRAADNRVVVIDRWGFETPKTKAAKALLDANAISGKVLVVLGQNEEVAAKSFRNLANVQVILNSELNTYDVMANDFIVFTPHTLPSSQRHGAGSVSEKVRRAAPPEPGTEAADPAVGTAAGIARSEEEAPIASKSPNTRREPGGLIVAPYTVAKLPARRYTFGQEYLKVERYVDSISFNWTTEHGPSSLAAFASDPSTVVEITDRMESTSEVSARDLAMRKFSDPVWAGFSIEHVEAGTWRHVRESAHLYQVGLRLVDYDRARVERLVLATGTGLVQSNITEVLDSAEREVLGGH